jgi:hypothetical protein
MALISGQPISSVPVSGQPALQVSAPKLASASVLRDHAAQLSLTAPKLASASVLRAHTVTPVITVTAPKLASTSVLRDHSAALVVTAPKLASVSVLYGPTVDVATVTPPVEAPATATTGGGPSNLFYRGKYRKEIRRTINAAIKELSEARSTRSRKRKIRRVAREIIGTFAFDIPQSAMRLPDAAALEPIKKALLGVSEVLAQKTLADDVRREKAQELQRLFGEYEAQAKRLDRNEEEEAIAMIMVMAA